jgi:hypothetical protein
VPVQRPERGPWTAMRSGFPPGRRSPARTCWASWSWSGCWRGWANRRHPQAAEPLGEVVEQSATAPSRSAISRRFAQTAKALAELLAREVSDLPVAALLVDGIHVAERCCVAALAITPAGIKLPAGLGGLDRERHRGPPPARRPAGPRPGRCAWAAGGDRRASGACEGDARRVRRARAGSARHVHKRRNLTEHLSRANVAASIPAWPPPSTTLTRQGTRRRAGAGQPAAPPAPRRGGQPAGGTGGDVHRPSARRTTGWPGPCRRPPGRVHDLHRPLNHPQRQALAGRGDGAPLGGGGDAERRAELSPPQGPCRCRWRRWPVLPSRWVSG